MRTTLAILAALAILATLAMGCTAIPEEATKQNLDEWKTIEAAIKDGHLVDPDDPDPDDPHSTTASWAARAAAARILADEMHRKASGTE